MFKKYKQNIIIICLLIAIIILTYLFFVSNDSVLKKKDNPNSLDTSEIIDVSNNSIDNLAPIMGHFTIPASHSSLTVPVLSFTATDNLAVTGYLLTETSATPSAASGSWNSSAPSSYTFSSAGTKTLYAWAKDAAGNVSNSLSDSVMITLSEINIVYIDPSYVGVENGTMSQPYNSWNDFTFKNNSSYLQKRGTTYTSSNQIVISNLNNVSIGAYGSGSRPIISYTGSGHAIFINISNNVLLDNLEIIGNSSAYSLIRLDGGSESAYQTNNTISNCIVHNAHNTNNAGFGILGFYNDGLKILNTTIYDVAIDGIYLKYAPNIEIGYSYIYDVNKRYFIDSNQKASSGDGIQLDGNYNNFHIHHTTIDRTNGAGNKYNLILNNGVSGGTSYSGVIEYNTFVNDSNISSAILIERGSGIITRYNLFKGNTQGIRIGGSGTSNNLIHNNIFSNCVSGVGVGYTYGTASTPIGPSIGTQVYNNIFYHISSYHIWVDKTHVDVKNNIHIRNGDSGVALYNYGGGSWIISNNCYGDLATAGEPGIGFGSVVADPLFVDTEIDFHLQADSLCIDAGIDVGLDKDFEDNFIPQGLAPDIGAYEYLP